MSLGRESTFRFVSNADPRLAVYMHLLSLPSPSFSSQFNAAAEESACEDPIPIALNIACG